MSRARAGGMIGRRYVFAGMLVVVEARWLHVRGERHAPHNVLVRSLATDVRYIVPWRRLRRPRP